MSDSDKTPFPQGEEDAKSGSHCESDKFDNIARQMEYMNGYESESKSEDKPDTSQESSDNQ